MQSESSFHNFASEEMGSLKPRSEYSSFRRDWLARHNYDLTGKSISELKDVVELFNQQNQEILREALEEKGISLDDEIASLAKQNLDASDFKALREKIGLPKWVRLSEVVAYIKTVMDIDSQNAQESYLDNCTTCLSLDDMKRVLAFENDVKPARLDTDIYHQSPDRSRSAVEIVSNAIDAVNRSGSTIGRFGVGFYQILSHLSNPSDMVRVTTGSDESGFYEIDFRLEGKEIVVHLEDVEGASQGTTVELVCSDFPGSEALGLVQKHFAYNGIANVSCNGGQVNNLSAFNVDQSDLPDVSIQITDNGFKVTDTGVGMSPQVILEKLLVPKLSGKKPVHEILATENCQARYMAERKQPEAYADPGQAVLNVGGVMIESIELTGINTCKNLVIDLPPFSMLGEERNRLAVDEITIASVKSLIDQVLQSGDFEVINSLAPVVEELQHRSIQHDEESNLISYLQKKAEEVLPQNVDYLPNVRGFERLKLNNTIIIDPLVRQTNWGKIEGLKTPGTTGEGSAIYIGEMTDDPSSPCISWKNRYIVSREIYERFKDDPTMLNLYLEQLGTSQGKEIRKVDSKKDEGSDTAPGIKSVEEQSRQYRDFAEFITHNWKDLGYPDQKAARLDSLHMTERRKELYDKVIANMPASLAKYFVDLLLNAEKNQYRYTGILDSYDSIIDNALSVTENKDLMRTMVELGVVPFYDFEPYEERISKDASSLDSVEKGGSKWTSLKYWDRMNVVHESGQVFTGKLINLFDNKEDFGYVMIRKKLELQFVNPETRSIDKVISMPPEEEGGLFKGITCEYFGDRRLVRSGDNSGYQGMMSSRGPIQLIDFETGEDFMPFPEGWEIATIQSGVIYGRSGSKHQDGNVYAAHYPDGHTEQFPDGIIPEIADGGWYEQMIAGEKLQLIFGGRVAYEEQMTEGTKKAFDIKDDTRYSSRQERDKWRIRHIKFEDEGKNYLLWQHLVPTGEIVRNDFKGRVGGGYEYRPDKNGGFFEVQNNGIIFDEEGNQVFKLEPDEIFWGSRPIRDAEGKSVLCLAKYSTAVDDSQVGYSGWRPENPFFVEGFRYVDMSGRELTGDELKGLSPVGVGSGYGGGIFSPYQGKGWQMGFMATTKRGSDDKVEDTWYLKVTDKSGKPVTEKPILKIEYLPEANLWDLTMIAKDNFWPEKGAHLLINEDGEVVDTVKSVGRSFIRIDPEDRDSINPRSILRHESHPLSEGKAATVNRLLESSDASSKKLLNRFMQRSLRYAELSDANFSFLAPALLNIERFEPRLADNQFIETIKGRLEKLDTETQTWFFRYLSKLLPPGEQIDDQFVEKFLKIFSDKIVHMPEEKKQEIFQTFDEVRDYGEEYITTGWNIVRFKTPVKIEQIPERIRSIVDFLISEADNYIDQIPEQVVINNDDSFTLSQLIQSKRLNETAMQSFSGTSDDLARMIKLKTEGKKQDHIQREIIHPIYYQSIDNPYLFIRELVQNAHDAVIKKGDEQEKRCDINIFSREDKEITLRIEDKIGMSLSDVLNYFLIPGETTKLGEEETIGYFGQGLFTLFNGAKEVNMQTGQGDGTITKLRITPKRDENGFIADLSLQLDQEEGDFKGTIIEKTILTQYPEIEAAYIKNAACTYSSLVDANVVSLRLNGREINGPQTILSSTEVPGYGQMTIYDAPNNVVTQRGLFVKNIDQDFKTGISDVEELLEKRGYVINIPDQISLTRSRNELARKQEVVGALQEYLPALKLHAYLDIFRQDILKGRVIQLDNLPYDYFYQSYFNSSKIEQDAEKIKSGEKIEDVSDYLDRGSLIKLLVLLPVVEINEKTYSMRELKQASLNDTEPLENPQDYNLIPEVIREKLLEGKREYSSRTAATKEAKEQGLVVRDFKFEEWQQQPSFIREQIQENLQEYERMVALARKLSGMLAEYDGKERGVEITFYSEPGSAAHATQDYGKIGFNLNYWKNWNISPFEQEHPTDARLAQFIEIFTHEYGHVREETGGYTHNQSFYGRQAEIIANIMHALTRGPEAGNLLANAS